MDMRQQVFWECMIQYYKVPLAEFLLPFLRSSVYKEPCATLRMQTRLLGMQVDRWIGRQKDRQSERERE